MNRLHRIAALATLAAAAVLSSTAAQAHGIWFAQRSGELALIYGEGAEDLDTVKRQPLITAITAYDASGDPVPTALQASGRLLIVDTKERPAIVAAVLDNRHLEQDAGRQVAQEGQERSSRGAYQRPQPQICGASAQPAQRSFAAAAGTHAADRPV
jgi:hypothetical protein